MIVALQEAWRTAVPDRDDRHGPLQPLMLVLTVVTGLVDAFSYLSLGHVFVANMTGNVVFGGFAIAGVSGFSLAATAVALAAVLTLTITGTAADSRLAGGPGSRAGRRLLSAAAMFLGGLVGALILRGGWHAIPLLVATALLAVACLTARRLTRSRAPWTLAR